MTENQQILVEHRLPDSGVSHEAVIETLQILHHAHLQREKALVLLAVQWAGLNIVSSEWAELEEKNPHWLTPTQSMWSELAALGCPHVDDLTIPAFANAAGLTEFQATRLLREALLLVFLLPRVWQRAAQGQIDVWRARKLADECSGLSGEAIAYIDQHMSVTTARHTQGGREAIIEQAKARHMPGVIAAEEAAAQEHRGVHFDWGVCGRNGIVYFGGALEPADARALETAVQAGAEAIKKLGSDAPVDVRRSWALGDLARNSIAGTGGARNAAEGALNGVGQISTGDLDSARVHWNGAGQSGTQVSVYLHLTPESFLTVGGNAEQGRVATAKDAESFESGPEGFAPIRIEGAGIPAGVVLTPDTVRSWFDRPYAGPAPKIIFRPVIDLNDHHHVEAYEIPARIKEHVALRDGGCVFPWCHRKARHTDCDHIIPWKPDGSGGPTCSCNLAPLCRTHHRAKTHADNHIGSKYTWWRYEPLGEGKYLWSGPGGSRLLRTNSGVYDLDPMSAGPRLPLQRRHPVTLRGVIESVHRDGAADDPISSSSVASGEAVRGKLIQREAPLNGVLDQATAREHIKRLEKHYAQGAPVLQDARSERRQKARANNSMVWGDEQNQPPPF